VVRRLCTALVHGVLAQRLCATWSRVCCNRSARVAQTLKPPSWFFYTTSYLADAACQSQHQSACYKTVLTYDSVQMNLKNLCCNSCHSVTFDKYWIDLQHLPTVTYASADAVVPLSCVLTHAYLQIQQHAAHGQLRTSVPVLHCDELIRGRRAVCRVCRATYC
jgi:hypothetical protein